MKNKLIRNTVSKSISSFKRLNIATSFFYGLLIIASFLPLLKVEEYISIISDLSALEVVLYFLFLSGGFFSYLSGIGKYISFVFSFILIAVFGFIGFVFYQELSGMAKGYDQLSASWQQIENIIRDIVIEKMSIGFYLSVFSVFMIAITGFVNYESQEGGLIKTKQLLKNLSKQYLTKQKVKIIYCYVIKLFKAESAKNILIQCNIFTLNLKRNYPKAFYAIVGFSLITLFVLSTSTTEPDAEKIENLITNNPTVLADFMMPGSDQMIVLSFIKEISVFDITKKDCTEEAEQSFKCKISADITYVSFKQRGFQDELNFIARVYYDGKWKIEKY